MSGTYRYRILLRNDFEQSWKDQFERLFCTDLETKLPLWLPEQVFQIRGRFMFYSPSFLFTRRDYYCFEDVLFLLGETEYVVVGKEFLDSYSEEVGIAFQWDDDAERDSGWYHIDWQPLEFFMFGRRGDWVMISSESYNIVILCAKERVFEEFYRTCPGISEAELSAYLQHCLAEYKYLFEVNYLYND